MSSSSRAHEFPARGFKIKLRNSGAVVDAEFSQKVAPVGPTNSLRFPGTRARNSDRGFDIKIIMLGCVLIYRGRVGPRHGVESFFTDCWSLQNKSVH